MLQNLSEEERLCHERAESCARAAKEAPNDDIRGHYECLEKSWLTLGRSYEFARRLGAFLDYDKIRRAKLRLHVLESKVSIADAGPEPEWKRTSCAPFDRDLELAVIDSEGPYALVFPCRRILGGWIKAEGRQRIEIYPTHWREWQNA
jgi:hypothetical protein